MQGMEDQKVSKAPVRRARKIAAMTLAAIGLFLPLAAISGTGLHLVPQEKAWTAGYGFSANDVDFLNLMGNLEAPDGFGMVSGFAPVLPRQELETMTIGAVLDYQRKIRAMGTASSAVGRYQFIYTTLEQVVRENGISQEIIFDEEIQTYLARILMAKCGFYDMATPTNRLGNCLAGRWASLPLLSGTGAGKSAYDGDGLNHHLVGSAQFAQVLEDRFTW